MTHLLARRPRRSERGTSLVELLVVVGLLGVVLPTGYGAVASIQKQEYTTTNRFAALSEAQVIADHITKDLRAAVTVTSVTGGVTTTAAFTSANTSDISFYANLSTTGPVLLHAYTLLPAGGASTFHEDSLAPDGGSCTPPACGYTGTPVARIDGRYIDTTRPIYTFFNAAGGSITSPVATSLLASIDSVGITLTVRITPTSPSTTITTLLHIRNVDYNPS